MEIAKIWRLPVSDDAVDILFVKAHIKPQCGCGRVMWAEGCHVENGKDYSTIKLWNIAKRLRTIA